MIYSSFLIQKGIRGMIWSFFIEVVFLCTSRSIGIWVITRFTWYLLGLRLTQITAYFRQSNLGHCFYRQQRVFLDRRSRLWKKKILPLPDACLSKKGQVHYTGM